MEKKHALPFTSGLQIPQGQRSPSYPTCNCTVYNREMINCCSILQDQSICLYQKVSIICPFRGPRAEGASDVWPPINPQSIPSVTELHLHELLAYLKE